MLDIEVYLTLVECSPYPRLGRLLLLLEAPPKFMRKTTNLQQHLRAVVLQDTSLVVSKLMDYNKSLNLRNTKIFISESGTHPLPST